MTQPELEGITSTLQKYDAHQLSEEDAIALLTQQILSLLTPQPQVIECDILAIKQGVVGHQVNCQGRMGAGLALAIR